MPSSFIRKHVRGLLRTKFGPSTSLDLQEQNEQAEEVTTPRGEEQNEFLTHCYLGGIDTRRFEFPEVYFGKTGLDLPCIQLETLDNDVFAAYTGPEGGLTEVGEVRSQPMVRMANIDDEMSLSIDGTSEDDDDSPMELKKGSRRSLLLGSCSSLLGPNGVHEPSPGRASADSYDWTTHDAKSAFGMSVSLYEKNPLTGVNAGEPIADVWGVVGRTNNGILALADGVNWGEGARLAARCAIRGAIDHLNTRIENDSMPSTTEVFHEMLAAFHSAHSLILQEGGMLTTLCVALVAPARCGNGWVLCVCNVGDSLCFVYNRNYGVREVTLGSHDIDQMRDMRDAGGALGPVDGRNPQLHNLTCSMTFVEPGDVVFITSDGVSDNFDPVVGKFCVIKKSEADNKENGHLPPRDDRNISISTKDSSNREYAPNRPCAASLPCVDAARRHELMLVRMRDIIANGVAPQPRAQSSARSKEYSAVSASLLCHRLIQFATQLSQAKRRVLEHPDLYKKEKMNKSEQRARRKMVREKIADMPGKLDHASVVAYHVARLYERELSSPLRCQETPTSLSGDRTAREQSIEESSATISVDFDKFNAIKKAECEATIATPVREQAMLTFRDSPVREVAPTMDEATVDIETVENINVQSEKEPASTMEPLVMSNIVDKAEKNNNSKIGRPISPYEQIPIALTREERRKKKHARGSIGRHTLGVDVQWLKKLVGSKKDESRDTLDDIRGDVSLSSSSTDRVTLRQRLRSMLGSNRALASREDVSTMPSGSRHDSFSPSSVTPRNQTMTASNI